MHTEERQRIPLAEYCRLTGMNYSTANTKIARDQKNGTQKMPPAIKGEDGKVYLLLSDEQLSELRMSNAPVTHEKPMSNAEHLTNSYEQLIDSFEDEREKSAKLIEQLEQLKVKNEQLRDALEQERIRLAKFEGVNEQVVQIFEAKEQTIQALEKAVQSREGQLMALNSERLALTQQLQIYRAKDELVMHEQPSEQRKRRGGLLRKILELFNS